MKKFVLSFVLIIFSCIYSQIGFAQNYMEGNTYYDNNGKAYFYDASGKAFYYPEPVDIQNITDNTQQNDKVKTRDNRPKKKNRKVSSDGKNLIDSDWWKTATLEDVDAEIDAGADVNAKGSYVGEESGKTYTEVTPLMFALKYGNPGIEIIQALIDAGADVNAKEKVIGISVLMYAVEDIENPEVIQALIDAGADVNAKDNKDATVLMYAARYNKNPEIIQALIDAGANVNAKMDDGLTPLMFAAGNNENPEVIKALVENGADVDAKNNDGWTALMVAARHNKNTEIIKALIDAGADVNAKDNDDWTVLMRAAGNNENPEFIKVLVENGADVDAKDNDGWTALMCAARYNKNPEIIKALIESGADITSKTNIGGTALHIAIAAEDSQTHTITGSSIEVIKELINDGADVNAENNYGETPLMYTAKYNMNPEITKVLIESGADVGAYSDNNPLRTAALMALINSNRKVFEILIKPEIDNFCNMNNSYSHEAYLCRDRLTLYFQKEHQLPSCTYNMTALLAITPFLQALPDTAPGKGAYALVVLGNMMSKFNSSLTNTFKAFKAEGESH